MAEENLDFEKPIRELEEKIEDLRDLSEESEIDLSGELQRLQECLEQQKRITYANLSSWERVQIARNPRRPVIGDYIELMMDDFMELYGDHKFKDDPAMLTGFARLEDRRILLMGHRRGETTEEKRKCNFGSAHPEGYRKALHKMKIAEKFSMPVVSLINTPGAFPGIGAEERGQARAIAQNLKEMARLETPIICIVVGEGGSGGALGIGLGDYFSIMENSFYSVISPEGCAAILWKDGDRAPEAAEALKLAPNDLKKYGVVDEVIPEPLGGAHRDPEGAADILKSTILRYLNDLDDLSTDALLERRYEKYRKIGEYREGERNRMEEISSADPPSGNRGSETAESGSESSVSLQPSNIHPAKDRESSDNGHSSPDTTPGDDGHREGTDSPRTEEEESQASRDST